MNESGMFVHRSDQPDVTVVVVSYNVRPFLEQALHAIERAGQQVSTEVIVVDNNSADGSAEMVRTRFPGVQLITNQANVGFSQANNQAIRKASGRYLFLLNPDTVIGEDTIEAMVSFMDRRRDAGAAGCMILNADGSFAPESRRAFPTPAVAFYRMSGLSRLFPESRKFGRYNLTYVPADQECEVDALSGSCMIVRRQALEQSIDGCSPGAGLLDESFFMYGEDLDWCYRIQQAGWKIYYTPATRILHYKGESTRKEDLDYVRLFYGAMWKFADKHFRDHHSRPIAAMIHGGVILAGTTSAFAHWAKARIHSNGVHRDERVVLVCSDYEALTSRIEQVIPPDMRIVGHISASDVVVRGSDEVRKAITHFDATAVVFSAADLSYGSILDILREFSLNSVAFRILSPDGAWLVGKRLVWHLPEVPEKATCV